MKHIDLEHETTYKVGNYSEIFVITANCTPTDENDVYDIKIIVKSKNRNRRRNHVGKIEIDNPDAAIETVKEYMKYGDIVKDMLDSLSLALLQDFPELYPEIDLNDQD